MAVHNVYLKIETILGYSPVEPDDHVSPPIVYRRDCMRNMGHEDGTIPADEVNARRLTALIYREYLDKHYLVPKPDKIIVADVNEPAFTRRVPGTVIYARPGDRLRIHVKNADIVPHSFHVHGVRYGIDSDGSWPFGTQSDDGRRSDEICPGQTWTYTYDVTDETVGAWPFHDHCRSIGTYIDRGLFGGLVVLPEKEHEHLPKFPLPEDFYEKVKKVLADLEGQLHQDRDEESTRSHQHKVEVGHRRITTVNAGMRDASVHGPVSMATTGPVPVPISGAPRRVAMMTMGGMPMPDPQPAGPMHGMDLNEVPPALVPYLAALDEFAHSPQPLPEREHLLHVPLFFHVMSGTRGTPIFQSAPLNAGSTFTSPVFTLAANYDYICGIHGPSMSGKVTVQPGGPSTVNVAIGDFFFSPATVIVGVGGQVTWTNSGPSQHSVVERGGDNLPSYCFNGRAFIGNTPTIVAHSGQRIRWYIFNLDLSMNWHNFHLHGQRWRFADQTIDVRGLSPAESFIVDTTAPPVLLLSEELEECQHPEHRPKGAKPYHLRGDFLVHCHVEMHMMMGLAALLRSHQTVWLTPKQAKDLSTEIGLALDPGDNACPNVTSDRCQTAMGGRWEELPGLPQITFMHAVLLAESTRILFWGYGPMADQSRMWDQATGLYTVPANQPQAVTPDENIWSGAHAHLNDSADTILIHGGFYNSPAPPRTINTERRAFTFDPATSTWSLAADLHIGRFYPTTLTLGDGTALTLFGADNANGGGGVASLEIFTPGGGGGAWSAPKPVPFNYFYYPWTFLLPGGDLFIAGPQKPARRFNPAATPIIDDPMRQYNQISSQRGINMDGTAVLLPLKPPGFEPRVMVLGGSAFDAQQTAEWIDLSVASPTWQALPNLNVARDKVNSVLLPDGRVLVVGGIETLPDGGPAEIFDPEDKMSGFQLGPNMKHIRGYHSAAILLPDGSVIIGGDPNGGSTPNERYRPPYFFKPRPAISGSPVTIGYGAAFSVQTPLPAAIGEVVLLRPGAVTHAFNQNQRYVGCIITGRTATEVHASAPPDGNIAPPGWYLLFLVDTDRVPSLGTWVRLT
jgi:FtsP/CotA-like multicopper oxidase with cupredoxin domain